MKFNGFEATVTVDGVDLPEFSEVIEQEKRTATCWIPSHAGKFFSFDLKRSITCHEFDGTIIIVKIIVDGIPSRWRLSGPTMRISKMQTSMTTRSQFVFGELNFTDDDNYLEPDANKCLGEISIEYWKSRLTGMKTMPTFSNLLPPSTAESKIHEHSKKALEHRAILGNSETAFTNPQWDVAIDLCKLASFTFKYRSIDMLRANGLAPPESRIQAPMKRSHVEIEQTDRKPQGVCIELDGVDEDSQARDEKRVKRLREELNNLERRLASRTSTSTNGPRKKIKKEITGHATCDIIDLT